MDYNNIIINYYYYINGFYADDTLNISQKRKFISFSNLIISKRNQIFVITWDSQVPKVPEISFPLDSVNELMLPEVDKNENHSGTEINQIIQ